MKLIKKQEINKIKEFRIRSKELFLTYPQSGGLELQDLINKLDNVLNTYTLKDYILSKELHEDGNPHIHVYLKTIKRVDIINPRYFDIELNGVTFHPNVQPAKKAGNVIKYILKCVQSKIDVNLLFSKGISSRIDENAEFLNAFEAANLLAKAGKIKEALLLYENNNVDWYNKHHIALEKSLRGLNMREMGFSAKFNFNAYSLPSGMAEQLDFARNNSKSVVLLGNSGTGKSMFVESYCIHLLKLKPLNNKQL